MVFIQNILLNKFLKKSFTLSTIYIKSFFCKNVDDGKHNILPLSVIVEFKFSLKKFL